MFLFAAPGTANAPATVRMGLTYIRLSDKDEFFWVASRNITRSLRG
jgi:hypothetical protein